MFSSGSQQIQEEEKKRDNKKENERYKLEKYRTDKQFTDSKPHEIWGWKHGKEWILLEKWHWQYLPVDVRSKHFEWQWIKIYTGKDIYYQCEKCIQGGYDLLTFWNGDGTCWCNQKEINPKITSFCIYCPLGHEGEEKYIPNEQKTHLIKRTDNKRPCLHLFPS